jgi:outer membrane protein assembly factor BamA
MRRRVSWPLWRVAAGRRARAGCGPGGVAPPSGRRKAHARWRVLAALAGSVSCGIAGAEASSPRMLPAGAPDVARQVASLQPAPEVIVEIRVHGNVTVPDEEVVRLAGVAPGDRIEPGTLATVEARLRASGKFEAVEVRKRYRSLDLTAVALVLVVHEPAVPAVTPAVLRPWHRLARQSMVLPILAYEEGYGFTYGARVSAVDWLGLGERLTVPLTWGGEKRAAVELDRTFRSGPLARVSGEGGVVQRRHPHYRVDERRVDIAARVEHVVAAPLRLGVETRRTSVRFGDRLEGQWTFGVDATLDTRHDRAFPGHAVVLGAGWRSLRVDGAPARVNQTRAEARGYLRLVGQSVLALRAAYDAADRALPPYEQVLLGGASTLRGHRAGAFAGDNRLVTSVELRLPLDSPVGAGKAGVVLFYDAGKVWQAGERPRAARLRQGAGVGVFVIAAPFFRLAVDLAADLDGRGTRVHAGFGLRF